MPSERISDGILCLKGQVMSDFLPEFEPCGSLICTDNINPFFIVD
ncbi:Transposase [Neisseria meningitidis]|nr:Transposase [Neisseria meningitidis]